MVVCVRGCMWGVCESVCVRGCGRMYLQNEGVKQMHRLNQYIPDCS